MNIYVCGAYGPRMGVNICCHCRRHLHLHLHSITRKFLITVKQTEKHLRALTVTHLHVNWLYQCISIGNGAASVIRTRDLTLTKGALYRWSYGSTVGRFTLLVRALQESLKTSFLTLLMFRTVP